jgi:predicted RecB family nuclease
VNTSSILTEDIFAAFLKCRHKAHLKIHQTAGKPSEYQQLQARLADEHRLAARQIMLRTHGPASVIASPPSLAEAIRRRPALILDATTADADGSCRFDALEQIPGGGYTPVLVTPHQGITAGDRMRLAFGASVLARLQGSSPDTGRIVHGPAFKASRVSLPVLLASVRESVDQIRAIRDSPTPPPLVLNRYCPECEYRHACRARAIDKDDLSLLRGLSVKEIARLNGRGIFTVTQFSHTFRPARLKRVKEAGARHDHALQALAIRERKVFVARRPRLPDGKVRAYLDVEGVPDRDFYYLIGLSVEDGGGARRTSGTSGARSWRPSELSGTTSPSTTTAATSRTSWTGCGTATAATPGSSTGSKRRRSTC